MTEQDHLDDAFDALLRASAPDPLDDAGFVAATMAAVARASARQPSRRRAAPRAPVAIARALVAEQRRHAAQARLWRWAIGGVAVGYGLMLLALAWAPADAGTVLTSSPPSQWLPLSLTMCAGALWVAWRAWRSS